MKSRQPLRSLLLPMVLLAAFVGPSSQANCRNWLDRAGRLLSVRQKLVVLQEGLPIRDQKIAKTVNSDMELAHKWLNRENRTGDHQNELDDDAEFIVKLPNWRDLTNLELRKFLAINSIERLTNSGQLEAHHLYEIQEITDDLHLTPADFATWRDIFPDRPLPGHPEIE